MSNEIKGGDTLQKEVRAKEVHAKARSYYDVAEQYAYKFLMELKKLRDEKLFRELGYKTFPEYCSAEWGVNRETLNQRIRMAESYGENVATIVADYGHKKALFLSMMEIETRTDAIENGIPTKSGRKPVESATQQEIAAYQRSLKEKDAEIAAAKRQADIERKQRERLEEEVEHLSDREPEIRYETKTEYIEVGVEEPYNRMNDEPFSVERGNEFYSMMREIDELYKKYAHLKDSVEELRGIATYDDDMKLKYRKADEFWRMIGNIFRESNTNIIDVEII